MSTYVSTSDTFTQQLGYRLMEFLSYESYPVILLDGTLASGKTTFTKGIAKQLGITNILNSPTYTILKSYQSTDGLKLLNHLDVYRLSQLGLDFDLEEHIYGGHVTVIEWPFQVREILPTQYILVSFKHIDTNVRHIDITCHGPLCKTKEVSL